MIRNIQITKKGSESIDSNKTLYTCPNAWEENGANLVLYKNSTILKNGEDYEIQDEYTIKLLTSAKSSDELNFIITQILDPSEMYSHDERMHQLDKINKKFEGKAQTSVNKRVDEEVIPSKFLIHSDDIWVSSINENPNIAQQEHTAKSYTLFKLTEDLTVAHKKGWYATNNGKLDGRLSNWIPPEFGKDYIIRLYDANNNEIPSSDKMNWRWDYQAGYLVIDNDFDYSTPFKITGFMYDGKYGINTGNYWKEPIFSTSDFPLYNNDDGDIRLVLTENKFYRFDSIANKWEPLNYGSTSFKDPVLNKNDLPVVNNLRGDVCLVLDESNLYVWDDSYGQNGSWILLTGQSFNPSNYYTSDETDSLLNTKASFNHVHDTLYMRQDAVRDLVRWRTARDSFSDLPPYTENKDGDVILTKDSNTIYRWYTDDPNSGQGHWDAIIQSNFSWKTPVDVRTDLPIGGNSPGDTRLVVDERKVYFWTGSGWSEVVSRVDNHNHDDRYMLKTNTYWKSPVDTLNDLPQLGNNDGDCRITLDTNMMYIWNMNSSTWVELVEKTNWLDPVDLISDLQPGTDGDVIYVKEFNQLYVWDGVWKNIESADHTHNDLYYTKDEIDDFINNIENLLTSHTHNGVDSQQIDYNSLLNIPSFYWKNPVSLETDLPLSDNNIGDARIVLDTKSIYVWNGSQWDIISNGSFEYEHNHDTEYYPRSSIDNLIQTMTSNLISTIEGKADINHNHDEDYYTKTEIDITLAQSLSDKADADHTHDWTHDHDERYPTFSDLSISGREGKVHWDNIIEKPSSLSDAWKTPVQYDTDLPLAGNNEGDLRLVLDTSDVWRWDGTTWVVVGHWQGPQVDHWESPVNAHSDLPYVDNFDGDIRLVLEENKLYRWSESTLSWILLSGSSSDEGGSDGTITDNDVDGLSYEEIQVYLNGFQGIEGKDWEKTSVSSIRVLANVTEQDIITIIIIGDSLKRYDFRGSAEGQIEINLATTFFRKEIELSTPASLITLPVPYNPGQKDLLVWLNGVLQKVDDDYQELSSTEFAFDRMLNIGDRLIIVILGFTSGEENYIREDYVATQDQHLFNLINEYEPNTNQLLVYFNGQLQLKDEDYIEVDGNSVRIIEDRGVDEGDFITFIILKGLAIGNGGTIINYASDLLLGWPSDGSWSDGYVNLYPEMNVADAIDELNEAIFEIIPNELTSLSNVQLRSEGMTFSSGFVANGNDYIEGLPGQYFDYLTKDREFYLYVPENSFMRADRGVIRLFVNGVQVDQFSLEDAFVELDRDGSQTSNHYGIASQGAAANVGLAGTGGAIRNSTNGYIQIMSVKKYNYKKIQQGQIRFKFFNGILRHGYNYIYATHSYDDVIDTTQTFKFFIDTKHQFPAFTGTQTLFENSISSEKYVSGVRYYSIGDSFRVTFNVSSMAYTVYSAEPFTIEMPGTRPISVEYSDPNLSGVSNPPDIYDIVEYRNSFTLNDFNKFSIDGVANIKTHTPFGDGEEFTFISKNRLINTYTNGSSSLVEYFRDEIFRLPVGDYNEVPPQRSYIWDSTLPLQQGDALLFDKGLRYANMSFADYLPAQQVDYSSFTGPQTYYRAFFKNTPKNSGVLIIDGITKNDLITNKIIIDLKLPTHTGWLSLNKYYEVSEFNGENGDGCLIDIVDNKFYYSSGTFSTAYSGFVMIIRITLPNDSAPVMKYLELEW